MYAPAISLATPQKQDIRKIILGTTTIPVTSIKCDGRKAHLDHKIRFFFTGSLTAMTTAPTKTQGTKLLKWQVGLTSTSNIAAMKLGKYEYPDDSQIRCDTGQLRERESWERVKAETLATAHVVPTAPVNWRTGYVLSGNTRCSTSSTIPTIPLTSIHSTAPLTPNNPCVASRRPHFSQDGLFLHPSSPSHSFLTLGIR